MDTQMSDTELLKLYVEAFGKLCDLMDAVVPAELRVPSDEHGGWRWQPKQFTTAPSALEALYQGLGLPGRGSARFPPLYEQLILMYRWVEVDLDDYRLIANEPADDLAPLLAAMRADKGLRTTLIANGYVQFGKGPEGDYDPVCFDFRQRQRDGDCRVVKLDHEEILIYDRIKEVEELAPSFRTLVLGTIRQSTLSP